MSPANAQIKVIHARSAEENKNAKTIFRIVSGFLTPGKYPKIPNSIKINHETDVKIKI